MAARTRTRQQNDGDRDPLTGMTFRDNVAAWLDRQGAGGPYREDHFRLEGRLDLVVGALLALFFVGTYLGFIAWLALTR